MAEFDLWYQFLDRDDVQALDPVDRIALISIATTVADLEGDVDGFFPQAAVRRVPWSDGPLHLRERIQRLVDAGFMAVVDDPPGWELPGWLDYVNPYRPGNSDLEQLRWGQKDSETFRARRRKGRERQQRFREQKRLSKKVHHQMVSSGVPSVRCGPCGPCVHCV